MSSADNILDDISEISDISNIIITNLDNFSIIVDKKKLNLHIQSKINKLDERMRYVNYKFEDIRQSFRRYSISIIYFATSLTLIEAFTNSVDLETINNNFLINVIKFFPLVLSSLISLLAAIIKFNRYEEKIEEITRATEKCIVTMAKLKGVKEELYFCKVDEKLKKIIDNYRKYVYKEYLDSNTNIENQLIDTDYAKYMKKVANNDIKRNEIEYFKNKKINIIKNNQNKMQDESQIQVNILELDEDISIKKYNCCLIGCKK